jgi:hypothetical protein
MKGANIMRKFPGVVLLAIAIVLSQSNALGQKKEAAKTEKHAGIKATKTEAKVKKSDPKDKMDPSAKSEDPVVGKTRDGKPVYEGARGGFYYLTESGNKSYVQDFVGAKIVGKSADGLPIYEGPRGGRFYYSTSGEKVYVKKLNVVH